MIDDASSDSTGKIADENAKENSLIKVLHRDASVGGKGKAAALNAGLKQSAGEIVLCFDAEYIPDNDIVTRFVENSLTQASALFRAPVVLNEPKNIVTRLVALERIGGYRVDQEARDILGLIPH